MAQQTVAELLNSFAEYLGTQDKAIIALIEQKITEFKSSLDDVAKKMAALENLDLKAAYEKGKQGQ